jgi:hypothetical protein
MYSTAAAAFLNCHGIVRVYAMTFWTKMMHGKLAWSSYQREKCKSKTTRGQTNRLPEKRCATLKKEQLLIPGHDELNVSKSSLGSKFADDWDKLSRITR